MVKIIPGLQKAAPAIALMAGTGSFYMADVPAEVRAGGICLTAMGMILADLQNDKKLGYTDMLLRKVRSVPGLGDVNEGDLLGMLSLSASALLGPPETIRMVQEGSLDAGLINNLYNYGAFPLGAAFSFQKSRAALERKLGKELRFTYRDSHGQVRQTTPISIGDLIAQVAFLSGAAGISSYGYALGAVPIMYTGVMFALGNGISIQRLMNKPVSEVVQAKMETLAACMEQKLAEAGRGEIHDGAAHFEALQREWRAIAKQFGGETPVPGGDIKALGYRLAAALSRSVTTQQQLEGRNK